MSPAPPDLAAPLAAFLRDVTGAHAVRVPPFAFGDGPRRADRIALEVEISGDCGEGAMALLIECAPDGARSSQAGCLAAIEVARLAGVAAPEPLWSCDDEGVLGRPFHVVRVPAGVPDGAPGAGVVEALGASLAMLHAVRPPWPGLEALEEPGPSVVLDRVDAMRRRLDGSGVRWPALEWVLRWLERRAPREDEVVLAHGRPALSLCRVAGGALSGIDGWSQVRWGHPAEDLAALALDIDRAVPGGAAGALADALAAGYRSAGGSHVADGDLAYWQVVACAEGAVRACDAGPVVSAAVVRAVLDAYVRCEATGRGRARGAVQTEILSGAPGGAGEAHLAALYGGAGDGVDLRRFARDVRDGVFDGACAQAARVVVGGHLHAMLGAGDGVRPDGEPV